MHSTGDICSYFLHNELTTGGEQEGGIVHNRYKTGTTRRNAGGTNKSTLRESVYRTSQNDN